MRTDTATSIHNAWLDSGGHSVPVEYDGVRTVMNGALGSVPEPESWTVVADEAYPDVLVLADGMLYRVSLLMENEQLIGTVSCAPIADNARVYMRYASGRIAGRAFETRQWQFDLGTEQIELTSETGSGATLSHAEHFARALAGSLGWSFDDG